MRRHYLIYPIIIFLLLTTVGCSGNSLTRNEDEKNIELTISAAASLQDALNDIKARFENENPNIKINYNFGSSGSLQQQIVQGAQVDLFFSADRDKFHQLVDEGFIDEKNQIDLLGNEIVLVIPIDSDSHIETFGDLIKAERISIGIPESVPAGQYAKEVLKNLNLWNFIEGKMVYAKDVRQVLTYVKTNNVDAGIVYQTDALISENIKVVATAKENTHSTIIYPLGLLKDTPNSEEAQLFYEFLTNDDSIKIFKKYGFKDVK